MPWITAEGLRCLSPGGMCPAGRIQARLAIRPQPAPFGIRGLPPAKIMPRDCGAHQDCPGLSTSHNPGTDSCARRNGTGTQPAGAPDPSVDRPAACPVRPIPAAAGGTAGIARGAASALLTSPSATTATAAPTAAARLPRPVRGTSCCLPVIATTSRRSRAGGQAARPGPGATGHLPALSRLLGRVERAIWLPFPAPNFPPPGQGHDEDLTHADIGIWLRRGPLFDDVGCLQRHWRCAPPRDPGRADRRREDGRDDRGRPVDVPASGLEAPAGAQRGRTRPVPRGRAAPAVPAGARAAGAVSRVAGQVRAGDERPDGPDGRLPQRATTARRTAVTSHRHGSAVIEYPSALEIVTTRDFDAPIDLVFDVLTKPEHVRNWFAPFEDKMTVCSIDLRVGGTYHMVFVTSDGTECSFRGTYLEIERPTRIVDTWRFEGWPDAEAVETVDLHETDGVTTVKTSLAFRDQAGRDHMTRTDGQEDSWDKMEDYLRSLVDPSGTVSGT